MMRRTTSSSGSPAWPRSRRSSRGEQAEAVAAPPRSRRPRPAISSGVAERRGARTESMPSAISQSWSAIEAASARPRTPAISAARSAEQPQVAGPDRPARAGQQGEHRGVGRDVVEQRQRRDDLGDLGQPQQARQADDLDRDAGGGEGVEDLLGVPLSRVSTPMSDHARRRRRGRAAPRRQPRELVGRASRRRAPRRDPPRRRRLARSRATWSPSA